jgi:hypothetical protein
MTPTTPPPPHPYWCEACGQHAPFRVTMGAIPHTDGCPRQGEAWLQVYSRAVEWVLQTGEAIP